jgi:hypothetical protein
MGLVETVYAAAVSAGLLQVCVWHPSDGSVTQSHSVGFSCPDESRLDGLAVSTEYAMTFPASVFAGLVAQEQVQIGPATYLVREVRSIGDGTERRARLTRV